MGLVSASAYSSNTKRSGERIRQRHGRWWVLTNDDETPAASHASLPLKLRLSLKNLVRVLEFNFKLGGDFKNKGFWRLFLQYRPECARTLVFIGDVVLSFGVHEQRGQQERLVQLILQVDVVEACKDGTRG